MTEVKCFMDGKYGAQKITRGGMIISQNVRPIGE